MELVFFVSILLGIFFIMLYFPTSIFVSKKSGRKDSHESILVFVAASILFILLTYLFASFYLLKSQLLTYPVPCDTIGNLNCLINNDMIRELRPSFMVFVMIFLELIISYAYVYYVNYCVNSYKDRSRVLMGIILFFVVSLVGTLINFYMINKIAFGGGVKYITLLAVNPYIVLPVFYLAIMLYKNREKFGKGRKA